jgi:hypothetical protein
VFLHSVGYAGHIVHSGVFEGETAMHYFSCSGWDQYGFDKKCTGTRYAKMCFLHLEGHVGHVGHSDASRA